VLLQPMQRQARPLKATARAAEEADAVEVAAAETDGPQC
jgi:hypothetical protein